MSEQTYTSVSWRWVPADVVGGEEQLTVHITHQGDEAEPIVTMGVPRPDIFGPNGRLRWNPANARDLALYLRTVADGCDNYANAWEARGEWRLDLDD